MRNKKYQIIYADPPWQYNRKAGQGIAADHYPTMSLQEICDLPVGKLADKDCVLFLWVTFPQLREGLSVIQAWGFQYKTVASVWVKKNKKADTLFLGLGHWTRSNAEICLLATKGSVHRKSAYVRQIILSHIERHSKKPDVARDRIVELIGDVPRIELFARQTTPGWDVWGNEIQSDIEMKSEEEIE